MRRFPIFQFLLISILLLASPAALAAKTILVFGDSLSAGYGIRKEASWPPLLAKRLQNQHFDYTVVNASISGETTSGGKGRLGAALDKHKPRIAIIALGLNDGLRGLPIRVIRGNLMAMTETAQKSGASVLIVGQRLPPNYGDYAQQFHKVFSEVAKARQTAFVDFLLDGVAEHPELFQADKLHPVAAAQPRLLDNIWGGLAPLLK